jgi:beta-phosphoglucomutase family hydrolase
MSDAPTMQAIIFDCDGTLADTMPTHYRTWKTVLAPHGIEFSEERFYSLGGLSVRSIIEILAEEQGKTVDPDALLAEKEALHSTHHARAVPISEVVDIAREWRGRIPLAVGTGGTRTFCTQTLKELGILDFFDAIVCAEDVPQGKPAPDIFLEAARLIGVPPEHCVVYEDTDPGIEAAKRAGMQWVDVRVLRTSS